MVVPAVPIVVTSLDDEPLAEWPVEIVERKGLGHPDTLCDALAEEVSLAYSRFCIERFGFVLHHNVDKVLLRGGAARAAFGGGEVLEPIDVYVAGRAAHEYRGVAIPVRPIVVESCRAWIAAHLHALDATRHVRVHDLVRPGSADLVELFERQRHGAPKLANDTSLGVGWAPHTPLERAVLAVEPALRAAHAPERGEDVKIMGVRCGGRTELTVACAFVDRELSDLDAYAAARACVADDARLAAQQALDTPPTVRVNAADDEATGSVYLTVTGTSAEGGDDGQTGRGNRASGLITPARPMTLESVAGKNAITHVGKLYNVVAPSLAEDLVAEVPGVAEAHVLLVSRIGAPVDAPQVVHVRLRPADGALLGDLLGPARELTRRHLAGIGELWQRLVLRNLATGEPACAGTAIPN